MSELREAHGDEIDFVIVSATETAKRQAEVERYNLTARKHGLVAFDRAGEPVLTISGHDFARPELEIAVKQVSKP